MFFKRKKIFSRTICLTRRPDKREVLEGNKTSEGHMLPCRRKKKSVNTNLVYTFAVTSFTPNAGSIRGGTVVTVNGAGFRYIKKFNVSSI